MLSKVWKTLEWEQAVQCLKMEKNAENREVLGRKEKNHKQHFRKEISHYISKFVKKKYI